MSSENNLVDQWFMELGRVWIEKDIPAVKDLLADSFSYYEHPFQEPLATWDEVEREWEGIRELQDIKVTLTPLVVSEREGCYQYEFSYKTAASGEAHVSRGAHYVKLNEAGRAVEFRQWWLEK